MPAGWIQKKKNLRRKGSYQCISSADKQTLKNEIFRQNLAPLDQYLGTLACCLIATYIVLNNVLSVT